MIDKIISFLLVYMAVPLAATALMAAGIMFLLAGSEKAISRGREIFKYTLIGLFIAFGAWLIIDLILGNLLSGTYLPWNRFPDGACQGIPPPPPPPPPGAPPPVAPCVSRTPEQICASRGFACTNAPILDNCEVPITCGQCTGTNRCVNNQCVPALNNCSLNNGTCYQKPCSSPEYGTDCRSLSFSCEGSGGDYCCSGACSGGGVIVAPPANYPKLNQLAYGTAAYGIQDITFSAGRVQRYYIPIDEINRGQNLGRLFIDTYSLGVVAGGDIGIKLISPGGLEWADDTPTTSGESINVYSRSWAAQSNYLQSNYPFDYIERGNWILEITAKENSRVRIWVRHDQM